MKVKVNEIVIPDNVEVVFEHYCLDCDKCEPVIIESRLSTDGTEKEIYRVSCNNVQICQKARAIAATEKAREYPFA